jgi:hypothetical protein
MSANQDAKGSSNWREFDSGDLISSVIVLGNGPSLRGVDLWSLAEFPTIGMNAAYRYWRKLDWFPTYYCCLDEVVVESHVDSISRLIEDGRIQKFFLSGRFLQLRPQYLHDTRIVDLDRVSQEWFIQRGEQLGKSRIHHAAFYSCFPGLITTGAWAVRWATMLGYSHIYLMGIDGQYTERLPETQDLGSYRLRMTATPERNPNYFFDDYQEAGDEFHLPNPLSGHPRMHIEAFAAIKHDFAQQGITCNIYCGQQQSGIAQTFLFPVRELMLTSFTQSVARVDQSDE